MWVQHLRQYRAFLTSSCSDRSTCAGGGAHRTIGSCELHSSACSLRCAQRLWWSTLRLLLRWLQHCAVLASRSRTTHQHRHASRHTLAILGLLSLSRHARQDTVLWLPSFRPPLLTDPCRLTVGPGTREDHDAVQVRDLWRTRRVGVPGFRTCLAALDMSSILTLCEQNLGLVDTFLAQELMAQCPDRCVMRADRRLSGLWFDSVVCWMWSLRRSALTH